MIADDLLLPDQTKRFHTWEEAKEFFRSLEGRYVFRGMGNAEWLLLTTLDRAVKYRAPEAERVLVESFQTALPENIPDLPPRNDRVSWLALMRHYGLPSRLLDCSESHIIAAYFAAQTKTDRDLAIWAIERDGVQRAAQTALGILGEPLSPVELGSTDLFSAVLVVPKRFLALVDAHHKTQRQQAQKGLFLCPGDPGEPFWRNLLPEISHGPGLLYRVVLPPGARREIESDLSGSDVNRADLLPDIHHLERLCGTLETLLRRSQEPYGHFQWKLQVMPLLREHGLLEAKLA
jgi:hypothetical protein